MLLTLGLGTQLSTVETVVTIISDEFKLKEDSILQWQGDIFVTGDDYGRNGLEVRHLINAGMTELDHPRADKLRCRQIRVVNVEGQLFFGAAGELANALDEVIADPDVKVVLLRLRRAYGMDVNDLMRLNGLTNPNMLRVGQKLVIWTSEKLAQPVSFNGSAGPENRMHALRYTVRKGDSLYRIADRFNIRVADIKRHIMRNVRLIVGSRKSFCSRPSVGPMIRSSCCMRTEISVAVAGVPSMGGSMS